MQKRNAIVAGTLAASMAAAMIGHFESSGKMILTAYQDQGGKWTICDGITYGVSEGMTATQDWCETVKEREIAKHSKPLKAVPYQLSTRVRVAWTDFCYNVGVGACSSSTGMKKLIAGQIDESCDGFLLFKYAKVKGRKVDCSMSDSGCAGIWTRRKIERDLCNGTLSFSDAELLFKNLPVGGELWSD